MCTLSSVAPANSFAPKSPDGLSGIWHALQFGSLLTFLSALLLLDSGAASLAIAGSAVIAHTVLAFIDVSYTEGRRHISPLEQSVHGYLEVLPLIAFAVTAILFYTQSQQAAILVNPRGSVILLVSYVVLAGLPIAEELWRTARQREARAIAAR